MSEGGGGFLKGGLGCVVPAIGVAVVLALFGTAWELSEAEILLLFVAGGVIGWAASRMVVS